jgi:hypothetical protein
VGVLALANWQAAQMVKVLHAADIPTVELTRYGGQAVDAVKVGTAHRAKGLAFKQILMAGHLAHFLNLHPPLTTRRASVKDLIVERCMWR